MRFNHDSQLVALASKTSKDQLKLVRTFACRGFLGYSQKTPTSESAHEFELVLARLARERDELRVVVVDTLRLIQTGSQVNDGYRQHVRRIFARHVRPGWRAQVQSKNPDKRKCARV
jgi:hypothetical protein